MHIINFEDNVYKQHDIYRALERGRIGPFDLECVRNLEDGIKKIGEQNALSKPYDLIITDMWYPAYSGGPDAQSGDALIKTAQEQGWEIPIILCSSMNYFYSGILGSVHYSKNGDWEEKLVKLVEQI